MASFLDKFRIKTAVGKKNKFNLSCSHLTTMNFFQLQPIYIKPMIPDEKISVDCSTFARLAAMPCPTFGDCTINNRAFFVPYRTIYPKWNDFITDVLHTPSNGSVSSIPSTVPIVSNMTLVTYLTSLCYDCSQQVQDDPDYIYDIEVITGSSAPWITTYYKFNSAHSRQVLKILQSLGYTLNYDISTAGDGYSINMNALPLLAYGKIWLDWYQSSQYVGDTYSYNIEKLLKLDTSSPLVLSTTDVDYLCTCWVNYDADPFVSAFDNPLGPTSSNTNASSLTAFSSFNIPDVTNNVNNTALQSVVQVATSGTNMPTNGTPAIGSSAGNAYNGHITQYIIDSLKALTDYMKRHQLVGSRAMDRFVARFGVSLTSEQLNRSKYIGSQIVPLSIADVTSTSDTTGANLGSYAGKGLILGNDGHFEFETNEYGYFIICSSLVPKVGYVDGIDPECLRLNRLDFWTPEFDALGTEPIPASELIGTGGGADPQDSSGLNQQVFGWRPRFGAYKYGRDKLTGNWRIPSLSQSGDTQNSWYLYRRLNLSDFSDNVSDVIHSYNFVTAEDHTQYNRMFYNTNNDDHFYVTHRFGVVTYAPMKPLYDDYDFESDGKEITMDVNGVRLN